MSIDLTKICTSARLEWLAIPKDGGDPFEFTLEQVNRNYGLSQIERLTGDASKQQMAYCLDDCHLCGFTGYTDSEGSKVYGGHVVKCSSRDDCKTTYWVTHWDGESWGMRLLPIGDSFDMMISEFFDSSCETKIIAHIHQPNKWSKKVKALLEKGENDDSKRNAD